MNNSTSHIQLKHIYLCRLYYAFCSIHVSVKYDIYNFLTGSKVLNKLSGWNGDQSIHYCMFITIQKLFYIRSQWPHTVHELVNVTGAHYHFRLLTIYDIIIMPFG